MSPSQIPLPFGSFHYYDFKSFVPGDNVAVIASLENVVNNTSRNVFLWGQIGAGKSHLLQAMCTEITHIKKRAAYIPLAEIDTLSPQMLIGLEDMDLVCVDDIDQLAGKDDWEQEMFHLFNKIRENEGCMLFSAKQSPGKLPITLADLKSRLSWDLVYRLEALKDESIIQALKTRAERHGFEIPGEVLDYLLKRISREPHDLFNMLEDIDKASMSEKKKITIPFVKRILKFDSNETATSGKNE